MDNGPQQCRAFCAERRWKESRTPTCGQPQQAHAPQAQLSGTPWEPSGPVAGAGSRSKPLRRPETRAVSCPIRRGPNALVQNQRSAACSVQREPKHSVWCEWLGKPSHTPAARPCAAECKLVARLPARIATPPHACPPSIGVPPPVSETRAPMCSEGAAGVRIFQNDRSKNAPKANAKQT